MRALVYDAFGELPEVRDVPKPACPPHGAVIRVEATGVCRSDWHGWLGHDPDIVLPHTPGHEFAGMVAEVGPEVRTAAVGQRVTVPFVCGCGSCEQCRAGDEQVCPNQTQPGFTHAGSFAEFVAVHHADVNLVPLPDAIDSVTAASLGCRFATAYRAVVAHGEVAPGSWVAVHGCGGVGLAAVMIAAAHGARVVAVDVDPAALALAAEFGAVHTVAPPAADEIVRLTGGGAHVSVEALGRASTLGDSIAGLRRRGRHVQVGLLLAADADPPVDMAAVIGRELEIIGSHGMAAHAYPQLLAEIADGRLRPDRLVSRVIGLEDAPAALAGLGSGGRAGVTVISLDR
ncbi:MAG TPA: zinc-dependent alcohol dehydrogenase family protein [Jatrophihabitans sp.]|jgi:alcohol dehydrogenase|nr:zinc-dependent alcohol dehydrogenase family protein [Jatrophihabitans sp.]